MKSQDMAFYDEFEDDEYFTSLQDKDKEDSEEAQAQELEERELIQKELDLRKGRLWEDPYAITEEDWSRTDDFSDRPNWSQQLCSRISKERVKVHPSEFYLISIFVLFYEYHTHA